MQNTPFFALVRPIFALITKIVPPNGIGNENWSRIWCDLDQKNWVSAWLKTFFFLFVFGQKNRLNLSKDFFIFILEITNIWTQKSTQSDWRPIKIWVKIAWCCFQPPKQPPTANFWLRAWSTYKRYSCQLVKKKKNKGCIRKLTILRSV